MTDFDYDVMQKKRIANGARHKNHGRRNKGCTLPYEYLTTKEKEGLNGEVMTYNFSTRMLWSDFKTIPVDIQEEYIEYLSEHYKVSLSDIAKMFRIAYSTMWGYIKQKGISISLSHRYKRSPEEVDIWLEYADLVESEEAVVHDGFINPYKLQEDNISQLDSFTLSFSGNLSIEGISQVLYNMLGKTTEGTIQITFAKEKA